jgi:hypothetical protein
MAGLTQSGYVARSPKYLDFVWLRYIKVTPFSTNSPSSSSILFFHPLSIMPVQSRLAILPAPTSTDIVPYNSVHNPDILSAILDTSYLTMRLKRHHVHDVSELHNLYSLDFHLAMGIWYLLKDLSRSIHEAADPSVDPFDTLPTYLNPNRLNEIGMAPPRILMIEGFSQNMLLSATTWEEVHKLFKMAQSVGLEALEWIGEAKRRCESVGGRHGWHWDDPEAGTLTIHTHLPLSESQRQIEYGSYSTLTGDSPTNDIPPSDASKAVILHPRLSNWAADHPEYNPFTSLDPIPGPPVYQQTTPSLEELLTKLEISKE